MNSDSDNYLFRGELTHLIDAWMEMQAALPDGWAFGGLMRRAGAPFMASGAKDLWIAIAVLEHPTTLGPVPELRGVGPDPADAMWALHQAILDMKDS